MGQHLYTLGSIAIVAYLLWLTALMLPIRHRCRVTATRDIMGKSRQEVWDALQVEPSFVISKTADLHDPLLITRQLDFSGGLRFHTVEARYRYFDIEPAVTKSWCIERMGDEAHPFGSDSIERFELTDIPDGVRAVMRIERNVANLGGRLAAWRGARELVRRAATGTADPETPALAQWKPALLSLGAIATFYMIMGNAGLILVAVLVLHEFGHWLAMKMFGHPAPRMMLIPFFGGIACGNGPPKTLFEDAMISVAGAAVSAIPAGAILLAAYMTGGLPADLSGFDIYAGHNALFIAVLFAAAIGAINLLQLIPMLPLDGGQILRALAQSLDPKIGAIAVAAIGGAVTVYFLLNGEYLLAAVGALGMTIGYEASRSPRTAAPMSAARAALVVALTVATAAIHITAARPVLAMAGLIPSAKRTVAEHRHTKPLLRCIYSDDAFTDWRCGSAAMLPHYDVTYE